LRQTIRKLGKGVKTVKEMDNKGFTGEVRLVYGHHQGRCMIVDAENSSCSSIGGNIDREIGFDGYWIGTWDGAAKPSAVSR
jgi:hypothetical protein